MTLKKLLVLLLLSLIAVSAWAKPPQPPHDGMAPPPPLPPPSPYSRIHFDMGKNKPKIDVDCGAQTSIKDCADVVNSLLMKAADPGPGKPKPPKP